MRQRGENTRSVDCAELPEKRQFCFARDDRNELGLTEGVMRKVWTVVFLVCILSVSGVAQSKDSGGSIPSKEDVLKFMEVLRIRSQLNIYFDGVAKQARLGAEEAFKEKVPNATPEQMAQLDKFADGLFKNMPIDEMIEGMIPIYQKHFTKEDLEGILAFYASPVGLKLQHEQPAMTQESMQVGGEIGRRRIGAMMQEMDEFIAKMGHQQPAPAKP